MSFELIWCVLKVYPALRWRSQRLPMLYAYPKNEQENISQDQATKLRSLVEQHLNS
ncbi:MAG: hypothetical protein ACI9R3_006473 [Verrucomicrobiales bacterium]|jgi:hypothetical protein